MPRKRATHSSSGRAQRPSGVPDWTIRPSRMTATRSPIANASPTSWVTWTTVRLRRSNRSPSSPDSRSRSGRSSEPSGSSSRSTRGSGASARARRDALALAAGEPAERAPLEAGEADELEQLRRCAARVPSRNALHAQAEVDVPAHVAMREERALLVHEPDPAAVRRHAGEIAAGEQDATRPGRWRPATTRRSVLLPLPLGPSTASRSPSATSSSTPASAVAAVERDAHVVDAEH